MTQGTAITPYVIEPPIRGVVLAYSGALVPEGDYIEPTVGQIWPR